MPLYDALRIFRMGHSHMVSLDCSPAWPSTAFVPVYLRVQSRQCFKSALAALLFCSSFPRRWWCLRSPSPRNERSLAWTALRPEQADQKEAPRQTLQAPPAACGSACSAGAAAAGAAVKSGGHWRNQTWRQGRAAWLGTRQQGRRRVRQSWGRLPMAAACEAAAQRVCTLQPAWARVQCRQRKQQAPAEQPKMEGRRQRCQWTEACAAASAMRRPSSPTSSHRHRLRAWHRQVAALCQGSAVLCSPEEQGTALLRCNLVHSHVHAV